jgi:hypothetical protein
MSFFKASVKEEDVKQGGGSDYLNGSGVYPVTILGAIANESKNGSITVDLFVDHNGQKQIVYGNLRITNNDGSPNEIGAKIFNQMLIIAGVSDVAEPTEGQLPIGKAGALKDVALLEEFTDVEIMLRIQLEYGRYNGSITEKKVIKGFYRAMDNATAEEIALEKTPGEGYERDTKYFDNITYKDGVTSDEVAAWVAGGRGKGSAPAGADAAKAPSFGTKRFGSKS